MLIAQTWWLDEGSDLLKAKLPTLDLTLLKSRTGRGTYTIYIIMYLNLSNLTLWGQRGGGLKLDSKQAFTEQIQR